MNLFYILEECHWDCNRDNWICIILWIVCYFNKVDFSSPWRWTIFSFPYFFLILIATFKFSVDQFSSSLVKSIPWLLCIFKVIIRKAWLDSQGTPWIWELRFLGWCQTKTISEYAKIREAGSFSCGTSRVNGIGKHLYSHKLLN